MQVVMDFEQANQVRYPAYHSLGLRVQRELQLSGSSLVVYGELWNAYNRRNVSGEYWDDDDSEVATLYQIPRLPVVGIAYRF